MRRSNLLTLRKFFNWNSSWFDNYNYSHLVLKDLTINIYLTSIFKILKVPTSMFNIKYFNNNSILITFDLFVIWVYKLYKYCKKFITKSILVLRQFDSTMIISTEHNYLESNNKNKINILKKNNVFENNKLTITLKNILKKEYNETKNKLFFTKKNIYCLKQNYFYVKKNTYLFFKYINFNVNENYFYKISNLFFFKYNKLSNKLLFLFKEPNILYLNSYIIKKKDKPIYFKYNYDKFNIKSLISLIFYIKNNNFFFFKIFKYKTKLSKYLKYLLFIHKLYNYKQNYSYSTQKEYLYWSLFFFFKYYKKTIINKIISFFIKKKLKCKYFFSFLKMLKIYKKINYINYKLITNNIKWLKIEYYFFYKKNFIFQDYWGYEIMNTYFLKKYFFSEFFNALVNSIQQTIYNYTNKQYLISIIPNIFYKYKPYIKSAKLISDYILIKAKKRFTLTRIFKTIKYWQLNEKIIAHKKIKNIKFDQSVNKESNFSTFRTPLKGLRILISGPPYKARRKVRKFYHLWVADYQITGKMPLQYINLSIDYYQTHITLKRATLGLKTWILLESYEIYK